MSKAIHLDNDGVPLCRAGNMKMIGHLLRRETDVRKVNCLTCLRTALIRERTKR